MVTCRVVMRLDLLSDYMFSLLLLACEFLTLPFAMAHAIIIGGICVILTSGVVSLTFFSVSVFFFSVLIKSLSLSFVID